jgi:predicted AlkP superfamily pyrophosphatase or phosphodiesterase
MTDPDANPLTSLSSKTRAARTQSIARSVRLTLAAACAAAVAIGSPARHVSAQTKAAPKLIVILVVDQMRADYLQWYAANYSGGLARLIREGAWFTEAAYPYLNTITCAGHSTIGTGSFPYRHGMILNNWYDPKTGNSPYCTDDPTVTEISYNNLSPIQGDSGKLMLVPAIGEQVMDRGGRSVALSLKPRSAVTLTGHKATAVVWFDDRGGWTTSSAFTTEPVPFLKSFIDANPLKADAERVWERTLPLSAYQGQDEMTGEGKVTGWSGSFPHPLAVAGGKPEDFYARWQRSPYADEYLERMAEASIDALKLGQGTAVDFLGVSFSAVDGIGHVYGPRSHEIQDVLVRLDRTIGKLLDYLDSRVGRGNYILGLSADHGVAEIPEQVGGGRVASKAVAAALEAVLEPALGKGPHVLSSAYTNIYLDEVARTRLAKDEAMREAALAALRSVPGIKFAFWGPHLATKSARASKDRVLRAAALSHNLGRSGDIIVAPEEKWLMSTAVTTHGTQYAYDQRVPVLFFGASVRAGRYTQPATPADVMPTLAHVAKVKIAKTDGRVLKAAIE